MVIVCNRSLFNKYGWMAFVCYFENSKGTSMTKDSALRLALEALEYEAQKGNDNAYQSEREAIKAALEAKDEIDWKDMYEKQKRRSEMWVAKYEKDIGPLEKAGPQQKAKDEPALNCNRVECMGSKGCIDLCWKKNTTPPQRIWVGLTDDERSKIWGELPQTLNEERDACIFAEAIELYLKERNK